MRNRTRRPPDIGDSPTRCCDGSEVFHILWGDEAFLGVPCSDLTWQQVEDDRSIGTSER